MISSKVELFRLLDKYPKGNIDAIVVEGYDGVGKGKILSDLSDEYGVIPYRPDYNLWQKYDHRGIDRWKVSGFFWDICSHFHLNSDKPMLFDRGVLSGAVYYQDYRIAEDYKYLLRDMNVLHILVTCSEEDYYKFAEIRGVSDASYEDYKKYTEEYMNCFKIAGVDYIIYENKYNESKSKELSTTCEGCGHYSHGWCRHPIINSEISKYSSRCNLSFDKEVQDINDTKMQCV